jgi:hypothetical protein
LVESVYVDVSVAITRARCSLGDGRLLVVDAQGRGDASFYDVRTDSWGTLAGAGTGRPGAALVSAAIVF